MQHLEEIDQISALSILLIIHRDKSATVQIKCDAVELDLILCSLNQRWQVATRNGILQLLRSVAFDFFDQVELDIVYEGSVETSRLW